MAWGASINDFLPFIDERSAKLILTLFRIVAIGFIFFWLKESIKSGLKNINSIVLSLILAGAIGNAIDSVFYGYFFTDSYFKVATFSIGNGYESLFHGSVVDMFQFPMFNWTWLVGYLLLVVRILYFLNQYLILQMHQFQLQYS